jgi:hypothetical protein
MEVPEVIRDFVDAITNADGERAAKLVTDDAPFKLPGDRELPPGPAGVATDELMYEMTVGGVFALEGDRISALEAFPSYEEAVAAVGD